MQLFKIRMLNQIGKVLGVIMLFAITHNMLAQVVSPQITAYESRCESTGKVVVNGNTSYLNILTGGNIPGQLGPLSGNASSVVFNNLQKGNYTLTVINPSTNEEATFSVVVPGSYEQNWTFSADIVYAPCSAGVPSVQVTNFVIQNAGVTQQRAPYKFRISAKNASLPSDGSTPPAYQNVTAFSIPYPSGVGGNYEVQAIDSCGNYKTINIYIPATAPGPSVSSSFVKFMNCNGDAQYTLTATGAVSPYIFKVKSGPDQVGTTQTGLTATFTLKAEGIYVFEVMDQYGGVSEHTIEVKKYAAPSIQTWSAYGTCTPPPAIGTGGVHVWLDQNSIGIGPVQISLSSSCIPTQIKTAVTDYAWSTTDFDNLPRPCTYTIIATDGCNKTYTTDVTLVAPAEGAMQCYKYYNCPDNGSTDYKLAIGYFGVAYNATPPFTIEVKDSLTNQYVTGFPLIKNEYAEIYPALPQGKYYIKITDACGATCADSVYIPKYEMPTMSIDVANRCFGAGQANVIGLNNREAYDNWNQQYNYTIQNGPSRVGEGPESDSPIHTGRFSSLISGGTYTFAFNDGCKTITQDVTIPSYQQPTWEVGFGALCSSQTLSSLQVMNLQPAQPSGSYHWRIIGTDSDLYGTTAPYNGTLPYPDVIGQTDSTFSGLPAKSDGSVATYNILGYDDCKNSYQGSGKIGPLPSESLILNTNSICGDGATVLRARVSTPVVGATYFYYRDGVKILESKKLFTTISPALEGLYSVKVIASTLPDSSCFVQGNSQVVTTVGKLVITTPTPVCPDIPVDLTAATVGSTAGTITYYTDRAMTNAVSNPSAVTQAGTYYVHLVTATNPICDLTDSIKVVFKNCLGSIGNYVWKDNNNNGIQDDGNVGVNAIKVRLWSAVLGEPSIKLDSTLTQNDPNSGKAGWYSFINLKKGDYIVEVVSTSLPATCAFSTKQNVVTPADSLDSDINPLSGFSDVIRLDPTLTGIDKDNPTIDAALVPLGSLGDYVWKDVNNNGIQGDVEDTPVQGLSLELYKDGAATGQTTLTDASGFYKFIIADSASYQVKVITTSLPVGCLVSPKQNQGGDDAKDSDVSPITSLSDAVTVNPFNPAKRDVLTVDIALYTPTGSLGDYVWKDVNNNGIQGDAGDLPVQGVTLELYKDGATTGRTTTTDANGFYNFVITGTGSYQVKLVTTSLPTGCGISPLLNQGGDDTQDSDIDPITGLSQAVTIDPTSAGLTKDNPTVDIGLINLCTKPTYSITSVVGTCNQSGANNDASIVLTSIVNGDKAAISSAGAVTFDGAAYASATPISSGVLTFTSLKHNTAYVIRIYNTKDDCFTDIVYTTIQSPCIPCQPQCLTIGFKKN